MNYSSKPSLTCYDCRKRKTIKPYAPIPFLMSSNRFVPELIAPCGMNCALCRAYNAFIHGVPRQRGKVTHCAGCLPRAKNCYIKRGCKKLSKHQIQSCSECETMPCNKLDHLDQRYRERYGMSMVENLKTDKSQRHGRIPQKPS